MEAKTWQFGKNLTAILDNSGTLTISGKGGIPNTFCSDDIPWNDTRVSIKTLIIKDSITSIEEYAFSDCTELISVKIPKSVCSIEGIVFRGCTKLTSIDVAPDNPKFSSENGVLFNKNKTILIRYPQGKKGDYKIPDDITAVGVSAFEGCVGLTSVTIPDSVTYILDNAFSNCTNLTEMHCLNPKPPTLPFPDTIDVFQGIPKTCCLHIQDTAVDDYKSPSGWEYFSCVKPLPLSH